jgi:hypothetical protein
MKIHLPLLFITWALVGISQTNPAIISWKINLTGATGYSNIPSNVQQVQYSSNNVYVSCSCVPDYTIGPWPGNPNTPSNQNFVYKITLNPVQNTGTPVDVPMGHIGVWSNGVSVFNAKDAMSYNNQNVWHQNAIVVEGPSFDNCLGHPAPGGEYHHHLNPRCLYDDTDSTHHSPIIGYAFDGFPIYGAYGYSSASSAGSIKRIKSSYQLRSISTRTSLPGGSPASSSGPAVSSTYPLGYYVEDFEYIQSLGDLDTHNGRFCVTPEYPSGIYAYFVTIDASRNATYPYTLGPTYYGTVAGGNTGPGSGHNTISESVTTYVATGLSENDDKIEYEIFPNPASGVFSLFLSPSFRNNCKVYLLDATGKLIFSQNNIQPANSYNFDMSELDPGLYIVKVENGDSFTNKKLVIVR